LEREVQVFSDRKKRAFAFERKAVNQKGGGPRLRGSAPEGTAGAVRTPTALCGLLTVATQQPQPRELDKAIAAAKLPEDQTRLFVGCPEGQSPFGQP